MHRRSVRSRDQSALTDNPSPAVEAIMLSTPSNRTIFGAFAVDRMPDLHIVDPAARALPKQKP